MIALTLKETQQREKMDSYFMGEVSASDYKMQNDQTRSVNTLKYEMKNGRRKIIGPY